MLAGGVGALSSGWSLYPGGRWRDNINEVADTVTPVAVITPLELYSSGRRRWMKAAGNYIRLGALTFQGFFIIIEIACSPVGF